MVQQVEIRTQKDVDDTRGCLTIWACLALSIWVYHRCVGDFETPAQKIGAIGVGLTAMVFGGVFRKRIADLIAVLISLIILGVIAFLLYEWVVGESPPSAP